MLNKLGTEEQLHNVVLEFSILCSKDDFDGWVPDELMQKCMQVFMQSVHSSPELSGDSILTKTTLSENEPNLKELSLSEVF